MRLLMLGPLEVRSDAGEILDLGTPRQQALLALLAIHVNSSLSRERIVEELWGDSPPSDGARNVRVYVARLRDTLEPDRAKRAPGEILVTTANGYSLRIDPAAIDAHRFSELVDTARDLIGRDPRTALARVDEALTLWRDRPLAGLEYDQFAQGEIRRLEELHLVALELRHEAAIRLGEARTVIPDLERLRSEHPMRERVVGLLMEALAETGRRPEALRSYRELELLLAKELGLEPGTELQELEQRILLDDRGPDGAEPRRASAEHYMPARITSFVGREAEMASLSDLLETHRLVTLIGPGGVGKTSLAIESARAAAPAYGRGSWFVDLTPLGVAGDPAAAVVDALGIADTADTTREDAIVAFVGADRTLLVLDNCEHVLEPAAALVSYLLQEAPSLSILATSRRALALAGESLLEVTPLELPAIDAATDELLSIASSRLVMDRATAVSPDFSLDDTNAATLAALCRRLDGIPLALELAASHLRSRTLAEVMDSLQDRLTLGSRQRVAPKHRSIREALEWSYELLDTSERRVFDRLAVFAGSFSREAALAVSAEGGALHGTELANLVDASMVIADVSGRATRYRLLPTLRDFGLANLADSSQLDGVRSTHAAYLAAEVEAMDLPFNPLGSTLRIEQNVSIDDFRAAAEWALDAGRTELCLRLLVPVSYWSIPTRLKAVEQWRTVVRGLDAGDPTIPLRLRLAEAYADWLSGDIDEAVAAFSSLAEAAYAAGEVSAAAGIFAAMGYIRMYVGDLAGAREAMAAAVELDAYIETANAPRPALAVTHMYMGDLDAAAEQTALVEAEVARTGNPVATAIYQNTLGWLCAYRDDLEGSVAAFRRCYELCVENAVFLLATNASLGLAWVLPLLDRSSEAIDHAERARRRAVESGNPHKEAEALIVAGRALLEAGARHEAARSLGDGLATSLRTTKRVDHLSRGIRFAGWLATDAGHMEEAAAFLGAADAQNGRTGFVEPPAEIGRNDTAVSRIQADLGSEAWTDLHTAAASDELEAVAARAIAYLATL